MYIYVHTHTHIHICTHTHTHTHICTHTQEAGLCTGQAERDKGGEKKRTETGLVRSLLRRSPPHLLAPAALKLAEGLLGRHGGGWARRTEARGRPGGAGRQRRAQKKERERERAREDRLTDTGGNHGEAEGQRASLPGFAADRCVAATAERHVCAALQLQRRSRRPKKGERAG